MRIFLIVFFINAALFGQHSDFGQIDYKKADSIANYYKGSSLKNLPVLTHNLTNNLATDVEKFRAIYTWVSTNITNDYSSFQKTTKKRRKLANDSIALNEWNTSFSPKVIENLLRYKKTACTGYAYIIRELATLADINCKIINGYGRTAALSLDNNSLPNHSWNAVELNGNWYLCDPTWSAGKIILEEDGPRFEAEYFDSYFLANPELFIKNHYPLEINWTLLKEPPGLEEFIKGPVQYKPAFKHKIQTISPNQMHLQIKKNENVTFTLKSSKQIESSSFGLNLNSGTKIVPEITQNNTSYLLSTVFKKSGHFDVHIMFENELIATYVVRVTRK